MSFGLFKGLWWAMSSQIERDPVALLGDEHLAGLSVIEEIHSQQSPPNRANPVYQCHLKP